MSEMNWSALDEAGRVSHVYGRITKSTTTTTTTLGTAGKLLAEQADTYMVIATKKAQLLKEVTLQRMKSETAYVSQFLDDQVVLFPVAEGDALAEDLHSVPTFQGPLLTAREFRAVYKLTDQAVRESISGDALLGLIMDGGTASTGRNIENILINGDITLDTSTRLNRSLRGLDGVRVQASAHLYNHLSGAVTDDLFDAMLQQVPSQFAGPSQAKFFISYKMALQYRRWLADRGTPQGDAFRGQAPPLTYGDYSMTILEMMDEAHGTSNKCTDCILTNPKNIVLGYRDEVEIEFERLPRHKARAVIFSTKFDDKIAVDDAFVLGYNIKVQP
jgi:hypothetical protein